MSLASFQRALLELAASPRLFAAARRDPAVLDRYDLTERERRRLLEALGQSAMGDHVREAYQERVAPLQGALPATCFLLGERLDEQLDAFWRDHPHGDFRRPDDRHRWAAFLREQLAAGALPDAYLEEVLDFEQALDELRLAPAETATPRSSAEGAGSDLMLHPRVRLVTFRHDPAAVLGHIALGTRPPPDLEVRVRFLLMRAQGDRVSFHTLGPEVGEAAQAVKSGASLDLTDEERARLVTAGLAVPRP